MPNNTHTSKYPEIVIDNQSNSVNNNMTFPITIEQFYDFMHHTHRASDLVFEGGDGSGSISDAVVQQINNKISEMNTKMEEQQKTIEAQKKTIADLDKKLQDYIDNDIHVDVDTDVDTGDGNGDEGTGPTGDGN